MNIKRFIAGLAVGTAVLSSVAQNSVVNSGPDGYIKRGILMYECGNYNGTIDQLSYAQNSHLNITDKEKTDFFIAKSYYNKGESNRALCLLREFIENYPTSFQSSDALATIGDIYFYDNDFAAAFTTYRNVNRNALATSQSEDVTYRLGYSYLRTKEGDVVNGEKLSKENVSTHRRQAETLFNSLTGSPRYNDASKFYTAYMDYEKGDYNNALKLFSSINTNSELGHNAQYYVCQIHYIKGNYNEAINIGTSLLANNHPNSMTNEVNRIVGEAHFRNDDDKNAYKYISQYLSTVEDSPAMTAKYILGVLNYRNAEYDKAIELLTDATKENDIFGQSAYYHLGQVYHRQGVTSKAIAAFKKAADMDYSKATKESAFYNYAVAYANDTMSSGNVVDIFEMFLNRFPNSKYSDEVNEYLSTLYMKGGNYTKALESINRIKTPSNEITATKQVVLYNLGVDVLSNNKVTQAQQFLLQARKLAKHNRDLDKQISLWLGECAYRSGDYSQAAKYQNEYLKSATQSDANYGLGYFNLGYTRFQQHKYDDARKAFNKAIDSKKLSADNVSDANNRIGDIYYYRGDFKTAQKYYEKSSGDYALYQKAMMLGYSKDYTGKVKQIKTLISKYPSSSLIPMAMLEQGDAYVILDESNKAVDTFNELIRKYPNNEYARKAMLNKAITERNSNNEDNAIATYKDILRKYPSSEEANVAIEDLKLIYAEKDELAELSKFINTLDTAPKLDLSDMERLAFEAAEKAYIKDNNDISKMKNYLKSYPQGTYATNANYYIAKHYFNNSNYDESLAILNKIELENSEITFAEDILTMKASILNQQDKYHDALDTFKQLEAKASTEDNRIIAQLGVFRSANKLNDYNTIIEYANKLLENNALTAEEYNEIKFSRAFAFYKQDNDSEASKLFSELAKNTNNLYGAQSAYYLAELQFNKNQLSKAEATLNSLIDAGTEHQYWLARAFILLADVYHKQGNTFEATEYLESLKNSYPGKNDDIFEMIESRLSKWNKSNSKN